MNTIIGFNVDPTIKQFITRKVENIKPIFIDIPQKQENILTQIESKKIKADAFILGSNLDDPITTAQKIHFIDSSLSVIILCLPEVYPNLLQAIVFAPFLGEEVTCISIDNKERIITKLESSVINTQARRKYQHAVASSNLQIPGQSSIQIQTSKYVDRLLDLAPIGVATIDNRYKITAWNKKAEELFGLNERDALGKYLFSFFSKIEQSKLNNYISAVKVLDNRDKQILKREVHNNIQYLEITVAHFDVDKNSILVIFEDITQRKLHQDKLKESEERFRTLIEQSTDAIILVDAKGKMLYVSESIRKVLGFKPEELTGKLVTSCIHAESLPIFNRTFDGLLRKPGKQVFLQFQVKHKDNSWAWIEITCVNHLNTPNINAIVGIFRNITERKKYEEELRYQKTLLEVQKEVAPEGILVVSPNGNMVSYNQRFIQMWKLSEELISSGKDESALQMAMQQLVDPETFINRVHEIYKKRSPSYEELKFKDGRYIDRYGSPLIGDDGTNYGYVWFFQDVTTRKKLERQKDEFISIASHELKTPVTSLKAFAQVLYNRFKKAGDESSARYLLKMDAQLNKLTSLIGDLLDVTKIETGKLQFHEETLDFSELVNEIVEEMQRTTERHTIRKVLKTTKSIVGDKDRIGQVITNFLSNAIKYSPHSNEIFVRTFADKRNITLCVEDYGVGISEENQKKVFERFYRETGGKQDTFPGLGLGLYICREIIERHNGKIWVKSEKGKGSTFCFSLPLKKRVVKQEINTTVKEEMKHE